MESNVSTGYALPAVTDAGEFELFPPGVYRFRLKDLEDAGMGMSFNGETPKPRTKWVFETVDVISGDEDAEEFVGREFWAWTPTNMNKRALMYEWACALLGEAPAVGTVPRTSDLIGKTLRATIINFQIEKGEKKGEWRHKIASVMRDQQRKKRKPPVDPEGFDDDDDEF